MKVNRDKNHYNVVGALKSVGATVQDLAHVGHGCPDILVGYNGSNFLLEIKGPQRGLNALQTSWHTSWKGQIIVVRNAEEAIAAIGAS